MAVAARLAGVALAWTAFAAPAPDYSCAPSQLGSPCGEGGPATLAAAGAGAGAGNPVHLATGNKHQREIDLPPLPGVLGLEWVRLYNAQDPRTGAFGPGWTTSYDTRVVRIGGLLQLVQADGSRIDFRALPGDEGRCASDDPRQGTLAQLADGYRWRWPDGRELSFDAQGRLLDIAAPTGARLRIRRGLVPGQPAHGQVVSVVDAAGRALRVSHDGAGRIVRVDTPAGTLAYEYDAQGRLAAVRFPDGHGREYAYAPELRAALAELAVRRPDGARIVLGTWRYDAQARVVASDLGIGPRGRLRFEHASASGRGERAVVVRDGAGGVTRFTLLPHGARFVLAEARGDGCLGCPPLASASAARQPGQAPEAVAVFDDDGRLARVERPSVVPGRTRSLTFTWAAPADADRASPRLPVTIRESGWRPVGGSDREGAGRDKVGRADKGRDVVALARSWALDWTRQSGGYRLRSVRPDAPEQPGAGGWPPAESAAHEGWPGLRVRRDDFGTVLGWSSDATGEERRHYSLDGMLARRHANGDAWTYRYDAEGRLTAFTAGDVGVAMTWDGPRLVEVAHPEERDVRRYDAQGRLVARERRRPGQGHAHLVLAERYAHDEQGRLLRHELAEGGALLYRWHADGRLARLSWEAAGGARRTVLEIPADGRSYRYGNGVRMAAWYRDGRLAGLLHARASMRPYALAAVWGQRLDYDAAGRIAGERLRGRLLPAESWRYAHDGQGRLAMAQGPDGDASFGWHADGSRAGPAAIGREARDPSGLPRQVDGWRLHYDGQRRLARAQRANEAIAYRHNAFGERISSVHDDGARASAWAFVHDGPRLAAVWRLAGEGAQPLRRYLHVGEVPVAMIDYAAQPPALYFLHADAIGLPRAVTDARGATRWEGRYSPFGELTAAAGDARLMPLLRLPGQMVDPATGWHDNHQRVYDPRRGQYLEPDPFGPAALHAHAWPPGVRLHTSAFGYAAQQPRRYADPAGLVLLAFDGTSNQAQTGANVQQFATLYEGDAAAPSGTGVAYAAGPGGPGPGDAADALFALSAQRILDQQWNRLIARLREASHADEPTPIDLVGYSRGAALARHFSNQVADSVRQGRFWAWQDGLGAVTGCVDLRFVGLFDSVAQFGLLGLNNASFDFSVAPAWAAVAHAVALHEQRRLFPLLSLADGRDRLPLNVVEQPFVGAHADIGGGLKSADGAGGERGDLSDIALQWMVDMARGAGVDMRPLDPAQATVSDPALHDFRGAGERAAQALGDALLEAGATPGRVPPGLAYPDRAVQAADGSVLAVHQRSHERLGWLERQRTESFIRRAEGWLNSSDPVAGTVDLPDYAWWLAQR